MILIARIELIELSAQMHADEADNLRRSHTIAPAHQWLPNDSAAQAEHDRLLLVAHQLRSLAAEMRRELAMMELATGSTHQPRRLCGG